MLDSSDWDYYHSVIAPQPVATPPAPQSWGEFLQNSATHFPSNVARSFVGTFGSIADAATGSGTALQRMDRERQQQEDAADPNLPKAPPGFWGSAADVVLNKIAPELPVLATTAGAGASAAGAFGAGARLAPVIGDVAAGAASGLRNSPEEAAIQGGEFGAMGAIGAALPRKWSPLFRAAVEGLSGAAINLGDQAVRGNDPFSRESLAGAGAQAALPLVMQGGRSLLRRAEPSMASSPSNAPASTTPTLPADWKLRSVAETPEGRYEHVFDTPQGEQRVTHESPLGEVADPSFQMVGNPYGIERPSPRRKLLQQFNPEVGPESTIEGQFTVEPVPPRRLMAPDNSNRGTAVPGTPQLEGRPFAPGETGFTMGEGREPFTPTPDVIINQGRKLLRSSQPAIEGGEPTISVEPIGEGPASATTEAPQVPAKRLRPLRSKGPIKGREAEGGYIERPLLNALGGGVAGAGVGYALPGTDEEKRNRAIMLGVLGAGAAGGRRLFRDLSGVEGERLARQQLTGIGEGKTTKGFLRRVGEQYLNVGKSEALKTAQEQARGTVSNIESKVAGDLRAALPALQELTPPQRDALKIFMGSDRGAGAKALLATAGLPKEVSDFVTKITANKSELQRIVGDAQSDPEKRKLIQDTLGNYVTEPYRAYVNPKEWQKRGVDPALVDQVVAENQKLPQYAGMTPEAIRADVGKWMTEVNDFGGDFDRFANEGTSRMSKSLFTERKALRPSVRKILGHIEDPIEREVLTVAKLAKSANTAKLVGELTQPHAVDEAGRRLTMTKADWQASIDAAKAVGKADEAAFLQSNYEPVPNTLPGLGKLSQEPGGMMAQRQVMDALQIGPGHQTLSWETGLFPMLNRIAKASHTLYNPSTHIHNVVQAPLQAVAAGLNPATFVGNIRRLWADPKRLEWAKQDGILDAHLGAGEFHRAADDFEKLMTPKTWANAPQRGLGAVHETVKGLYGKPDQWTRGAAYNKFLDEALGKQPGAVARFFGAKAKTPMSIADARRYAVEMTNRYTQNYSNVASGVGLLRNVPLVNPFISYSAEMLRVIKNLAEDVATNANGRRYASAAALTTYLGLGSGIAALINSARSPEDKEKLQSLIPLLPPYMRSRTQFMVGNPKGGNTNLFNANPWLPAEDFIQTAKNIANGDWDALADTNPVAGLERNPLLNIYTETSTGKDTATGQPTSFLQSVRQNMLPGWVPGNYTADKLAKGFTRNADGELGVTDASGRRETPLSAVGSLFGVSVAQMNPRKLLQRQQMEQKDQLETAQSNLRRILRSDTNDAAKEEARQEFVEKRRRLLQRR